MKTTTLTALTLTLTLGSPADASLLQDGSFDLSDSGTLTSNSDWALNVNFPDGVNPAATFQQGSAFSNDPGDPRKGVWFRSYEGTQGDGDAFAHATLTQSVIVGPAGDYTLTFDAKREQFFTAGDWRVTLDSSESGTDTIDLLVAAPNDGAWHSYQLNLVGVAAGETLVVSATMLNGEEALGANPQSAFVDNFVLVPEPSSLALIGIAGLLVTHRRKRH